MSMRTVNPKLFYILIVLIGLALACNLPLGADQESDGPAVKASTDVDGGQIQGPGGLQLVVPAGAVQDTTEIQIAEVPSQPEPMPGFVSGSNAYQVDFPPGTNLRMPVEVILPLDEDRPDLDYGVFRWDDGGWNYLGGEVAEDGIHVYVDHFSGVEAWGSVNIATRPLMFINYGGDPAWIFAWEWDTNESTRLGMPAAFVMRRGLFGKDPTWWFNMYPMGTIYSWCVQWEEWTKPYWDLHGGGFVSEYEDTYNFILDYTVVISPDTPQGDYTAMERVEFSTGGGGQVGTCGNPPGQRPKTPTPEATQTTTPATPTGNPTETPLGTATDTPEAVPATPELATETAATNPNETATPDMGNLTPQEYANQGTFLYDATCIYSDGDSDTSQITLSFQFSDNGVSMSDAEYGDTIFFAKREPNIYDNTEEDLFSTIIFTDTGFDYFGEGYGLTGDCDVIRK